MGSLLKSVILLLLTSLSSCFYLMPNCKSGFELYKKPIKLAPKYNFKINNGFYSRYKDTVSYSSGRFFFSNGKTKSSWFEWENKNMFKRFSWKENWADYSIIGDTIIIQGFNHHNQEVCRRWVIETKGVITSDSTFVILENYDYRFNEKQVFDSPIELYFVPLSEKPDSTVAWYIKKDWYKANVHRDRK